MSSPNLPLDRRAQLEGPRTSAAVIGAGPMGLLLTVVLAHSRAVVLACRNAAVRRDIEAHAVGLDARGPRDGEIMTAHPKLVPSISDLAHHRDLGDIFIATKTSAIPAVASELRPVLTKLQRAHDEVRVVSFQNGIDPGRELIQRLQHRAVLRMVLTLGVLHDDRPGAVRLTMNRPPHAIGTLDPTYQSACHQIARELSRAGLETQFRSDIESVVWQKGLVNAAVNPVAALVNGSVSDVLDAPASTIVPRLLEEGIAVAKADAIALPPDFEKQALELIEQARAHVPSMVEDIRRGRETEVGQLNRQIIAHARRRGIPTPTHDTVDALIETFDWRVYKANAPDRNSPKISSRAIKSS